MTVSDQTLTDTGLAPKGTGRILVLGCGALAREILVFTKQMPHIDLHCLPAILHNHPDQIVPALRAAIGQATEYDRIFLAYADCGTGGHLQTLADEMGVDMLPGPHCYAFFEGTEQFLERAEEELTAFYLTDFLARQFDAFVWKPLGLDRHPELLDSYFGHYEKLVFQAQTNDPDLTAIAENCAQRMGLAFERRETGYGELGTALQRLARDI